MKLLRVPPKWASSSLFLEQRPSGFVSALNTSWRGITFSLLIVFIATSILFILGIAPYNVNMVFMLVTLVATVWFGLSAGVFTAVIAFICFDYFFIPPIFTFTIDAIQGWLAVFLFLGTALFANQVAGRARLHSQQAEERAREITALYELATTVITKIDRTQMLETVLQQLLQILKLADCILYLAKEDEANPSKFSLVEAMRVGTSSPNRHPDPDLAEAVFQRGEVSFFLAEYFGLSFDAQETLEPIAKGVSLPGGPAAYLPLASGARSLGVLVLIGKPGPEQSGFSSEERRLFNVFARHIALAVEHARLVQETAQLAALRESDQLKSALLASVSHEFRTPLTAIKTATANLMLDDFDWDIQERHEILGVIEQETNRLARLVSNLLDLSKLEAGVLTPNFGWYYLPEIVEEVTARLTNSPLMRSRHITTQFAPDIPLTRLDYLQIDQVLTNLIENAAKYSAEGRPIRVQVEVKPLSQIMRKAFNKNPDELNHAETQLLLVKVVDEGIGIPPEQVKLIFDKFYRVQQGLNGLRVKTPGTGIGLTISRGIVEAHGGQIWAQQRVYGGTIFNFTLPILPFSDPLSMNPSGSASPELN